MSDRERAKAWIDEMSSNNLDRIYFMNLVLTKEELIIKKCNLKKEKQQLISFLKDKINNLSQMTAQFITIGDKVTSIPEIQIETFQEVLNFVNKGGKE